MSLTPKTEDTRSKFNIFLAGSIQCVHDWQSKLAKEFEDYQDVAFFSPRRDEFKEFDYNEHLQVDSSSQE